MLVIFSAAAKLECSSTGDFCCGLATSEITACPWSFSSPSLLSPLWWKCDWIFGLHPLAQLPAPVSTQQRLRLAHFRPLGLRHFLGFHQVKELLQTAIATVHLNCIDVISKITQMLYRNIKIIRKKKLNTMQDINTLFKPVWKKKKML